MFDVSCLSECLVSSSNDHDYLYLPLHSCSRLQATEVLLTRDLLTPKARLPILEFLERISGEQSFGSLPKDQILVNIAAHSYLSLEEFSIRVLAVIQAYMQ